MSWSVSARVEDGDTSALEDAFAQYNPNAGSAVLDQFSFCCDVITKAFESDVVEGAYNVNLNGHDDPEQPTNRKSLGLSFSPIYELSDEDGA